MNVDVLVHHHPPREYLQEVPVLQKYELGPFLFHVLLSIHQVQHVCLLRLDRVFKDNLRKLPLQILLIQRHFGSIIHLTVFN